MFPQGANHLLEDLLILPADGLLGKIDIPHHYRRPNRAVPGLLFPKKNMSHTTKFTLSHWRRSLTPVSRMCWSRCLLLRLLREAQTTPNRTKVAVVGCLQDLLLLSRLLSLWHSSWSAMEAPRTSWTSETRTLANVAGLLMRLLLLALLGSNWCESKLERTLLLLHMLSRNNLGRNLLRWCWSSVLNILYGGKYAIDTCATLDRGVLTGFRGPSIPALVSGVKNVLQDLLLCLRPLLP
jgi:hypothetical protein